MPIILTDCPTCGSRVEWDPVKTVDQRCTRCQTITGTDVGAIIKELRKTKVPGQEPMLRLIELVNDKLNLLEAKNVVIADTKQNRKA